MRVSPRELRGISRDGMLVRFALLGPVAFVQVEVPAGGSAGTGLEQPSLSAGWGFVLRGQVTLHGATTRDVPAGTAFYVPPGPPDHYTTAIGGTILAGFAPIQPDLDASDQGLRRQGFKLLPLGAPRPPLPQAMRSGEPSALFREPGSIEVETAQMGEWLFASSTFGPLTGYTSGWCDLPHWGMVLSGDFALKTEDDVELFGAGDVYYCPAGPPGHQFQVVDSATTIDYTPIAEFDGPRRMAEWRWGSWRKRRREDGEPDDAAESDDGRAASIARAPGLAASVPGLPPGRGVEVPYRRTRRPRIGDFVPARRSWVGAPTRGLRPTR